MGEMAILQALRVLVLASAVYAAPSGLGNRQLVSSPALCENRVSAFLVSDNTAVVAQPSRVYENVTEDACRSICSNNKDVNGRSTLCASFNYDHSTFTCTVFRERSYPDGEYKREIGEAKRYFEKICLGEDLPTECADVEFVRADGYIVDGFATNVSVAKSLEECVSQCLREQFMCKSAMYFPDEGECITNTESAISKPDHFGREENDEVIYIQNGCAHSLAVQERLAKAAESAEENGKAKAHKPVHKKIVPRKNAAKVATTTVAPIEETTTAEATDSAEESDSSEATTAAAEQEEQTSEGSEEHETEDASSEEAEAEATTESTTTTTTMTTTSTTTTTKVPSSTKRPRKHHKRPSKKTSPTPTPTTSTFAAPDEKKNKESFENEAEGTTEAATIATVSATKLPSEPAKPDEKNKDKETNEAATEEPVATTEEPRKEADIYFSDWSEWTECVNPGERKIRRRMCLNMKKCVGSLMEIGWCPEDLPVQVKSSEGSDEKESGGPVGPVRTPLPVADSKNTAEAGSPPSILPPQMPKRELKPLPKDAPGTANDIWSPWLGVCQHFASGQPCKNHEVIGFESRECIAKDPSLCKGPFFRYCTLKC